MIGVLIPLAVLLLIGIGFLFILKSRVEHAPISLGTLYTAVVLLYACYPLLMYLGLDGYYTPFNDGRLYMDQPSPAEIGRIAWYHAAYLGSFTFGYLLQHRARSSHTSTVSIADLDSPSIWALLSSFLFLRATTLVAELMFAAPAQDYLETYLKYKQLPLLAQQLLGHFEGMSAVLSLVVMAFLCQRWAKYRVIVCGWLIFECCLLVVGMGARTQFVLLCLAAIFSYHFLWRPISAKRLVASGFAVLIGFLAFGILRLFTASGLAAVGVEAVASSSEFESLFANAYEVDRLIISGDISRSAMTITVYFGDLINLIPQQLAPFEKVSLSDWYLNTYHSKFAESGGGLAFGAISESIVGTGWPDIVWRGVLVGYVFCWIDRAALSGPVNLWRFAMYLWLLTTCYMTFRLTTLALLPLFVYRFLPAMLIVSALAYLFRAAALAPGRNERLMNSRTKSV